LELLISHLDSENKGFHPIRLVDSRGEGGLVETKEVSVIEEVEGSQGGNINRVTEGEGRDISGIKEEEDLLELPPPKIFEQLARYIRGDHEEFLETSLEITLFFPMNQMIHSVSSESPRVTDRRRTLSSRKFRDPNEFPILGDDGERNFGFF
jgi:hypothetical protein